MECDDRFSKLGADPRYKKIAKKERKVKIDARFEKMFTDKRFHTKFSVDKRGKIVDETEREDLHKFYAIDDNDIGDDLPIKDSPLDEKNLSKDEDTKPDKCRKKKKGRLLAAVTKGSFGSARKHTSLSKRKRNRNVEADNKQNKTNIEIDFNDIRGETLLEDYDSSSDEDTIENVNVDETDDGDIIHGWGELDEDVKRIENAETNRLAVCNCDWDRISANDLYILFNSFKPVSGTIKSVKIYPSEFGINRMKEEEINGPKELQDSAVEKDGKENEEGSSYHMEKLREYQLNRLKYYYAVVECDTIESANKIYEECDGMEYEMSATRLDLRFIPDNTTFDHQPKSVATGTSQLKNYEPVQFVNTALQQSNVRLTWDETDVKRVQTTMRQFTKEDIESMDFKDYLASSEDEDEVDEMEDVDSERKGGEKDDEERKIKIYHELMQEIEAKEEKENDKLDMEVTFKTGIHADETSGKINAVKGSYKNGKIKSTLMIENTSNNGDADDVELSGSEELLSGNDNSSEDELVSEEELSKNGDINDELVSENDSIPASGFDDPFFSSGYASEKKAAKKKKKKKKSLRNEEKCDGDEKGKEELELLLLDESEDKKHFSLQGIINAENEKKSKRKRKKEKEIREEDTFKLDVNDPRFSALYSSHLYALDPSEPNFKKTNATQAIIEETQRRRKADESSTLNSDSIVSEKFDTKLSGLIKSVKSKTMQHRLKTQGNKSKISRS